MHYKIWSVETNHNYVMVTGTRLLSSKYCGLNRTKRLLIPKMGFILADSVQDDLELGCELVGSVVEWLNDEYLFAKDDQVSLG